MSTQDVLNRIRGQYAKPLKRICDKCGSELTVEQTKYWITEVCENCFEHCSIIDIKSCCDNQDYHRVKYVTDGGAITVREQCKGCGNLRPNAIGGYDKEARNKLPDVDLKARENRDKMYSEQYQAFYKQVNEKKAEKQISRREQIRDNWFKQYNKYLDSPEWRQKRALVLKRDGYLCQCCLQNQATQVHHKSYQFVDLAGSEPAFDLVSICKPCHDKIEDMKAERKKQQIP